VEQAGRREEQVCNVAVELRRAAADGDKNASRKRHSCSDEAKAHPQQRRILTKVGMLTTSMPMKTLSTQPLFLFLMPPFTMSMSPAQPKVVASSPTVSIHRCLLE